MTTILVISMILILAGILVMIVGFIDWATYQKVHIHLLTIGAVVLTIGGLAFNYDSVAKDKYNQSRNEIKQVVIYENEKPVAYTFEDRVAVKEGKVYLHTDNALIIFENSTYKIENWSNK
jgi:hypothetical protein